MLSAYLFLLAVMVGLVKRNGKVVSAISAIASAAVLLEAIGGIPQLSLQADELSRFFLLLLGTAGVAVSIYSYSYMKPRHLVTAAYPLFLLSMELILLSRDFLQFIAFWELMTLTSYVLIVANYAESATKRASLIYLVTMQALNTAPLLLALGYTYALFNTLSFETLKGNIPPAWVLWLFLVGFMTKAGIFPLHFWLPEAHPVAPSNVSALLSGVMLKMAVYGMLRVASIFPNTSTLATPIIILSMATIAIGALLMLVQRDLKRMIAYSSVDNLGYIFLAFGAYLALHGTLKTVALAALLLHSFNHMLFKNLLFMVSGNVLHATGRKDLGLRGLGRNMPSTFALSIIGILAVSGVPPLNGFVSKWLIYQATFLSGSPVLIAGGVIALFGSAVTLAAYLKMYRIFTGEPEGEVHEVEAPMLVGEGLLALLCVLLGVFPWLGIKLTGTDIGFEIDMPLLTIVLALFSGVLFIALPPRGRRDDVWTNGERVEDFDILPEHMYYPLNHISEGLSKAGSSAGRILARIGGAVASVEVDYIDEALFLPPARLLRGMMGLLRECPLGVMIVVLLLIASALIWGWFR